MNETRLKNYSDQLEKVYVNEYDDYIFIDAGDHGFLNRFADFIHWLESRQKELDGTAKEMEQKYNGRMMISENEDGDVEVDAEQLTELVWLQLSVYKECAEKVDEMFGQDTLKKYFRVAYEISPEFVPDIDCVFDFIEEITPALEKIYGKRAERIDKRYNKGRRGKHTKTKSELISEGKKKAAGKNE